MTVSDHELMHRCRHGDVEAFETLVRRWQGPVSGILTRLTGSPSNGRVAPDVEDLVQEVFLRVLSACDRYRSHCAFSTWIYRIALNASRDAARRRNTQRKMMEDRQQEKSASYDPAPDEIVQKKDIEREIVSALNRLPAKLREPLVLKHFGELTFAEVAEVTGLPLSTVKSRVQTGLLQLQSELKRRGIDEQDLKS